LDIKSSKVVFFHALLTQFNLRNFPQTSIEGIEHWLEWTRSRILLFRKYCLPSVLNQTNRNFKWIIYFDRATPSEFSTLINELKSYDFIEVCFCDGMDDFFIDYFEQVKQRIPKNCQWVMTTRLDNDDMLHKDAIASIQNLFEARNNYMISLSSGYVLDVNKSVLAHYFYPMSPFISLIESVASNPTGIFFKPHSKWPSLRLYVFKEFYFTFFKPSARMARFVFKRPLWIQIFHGQNVSNSFYRGVPVLYSGTLSDFGLNIRTKKMSLKDILMFRNYVLWKWYIKASIVRFFSNY
jgi:hypothetical protein